MGDQRWGGNGEFVEEVTGRQPWYVPATLWAGPVFWASILALLNFNSFRTYGRLSFDAEDWALHALGLVVLFVPMFLPYRNVSTVGDRIVARHYVGRSVDLSWSQVRRVELESYGLPEARTHVLRLIPTGGRKISFTSQLSNFDALRETVLERTAAPIVSKHSANFR